MAALLLGNRRIRLIPPRVGLLNFPPRPRGAMLSDSKVKVDRDFERGVRVESGAIYQVSGLLIRSLGG